MFRACIPCGSVAVIGVLIASTQTAAADDSVFQVMFGKCVRERQAFCDKVMPKDIRVGACLYAHEGRASPGCTVAIYDGMLAMNVALGTTGGNVRTCRTDLMNFCGSTKPGSGRLYGCLVENRNSLSKDCQSYLDPARMELEKLGLVN